MTRCRPFAVASLLAAVSMLAGSGAHAATPALGSTPMQQSNRLVDEGNGLAGAGDTDGAIAKYTAAVRVWPDNYAAYAARDRAREKAGDYQGMVEDTQAQIRLKPAELEAFLRQAFAYTQIRNYEAALADMEWALMLQPEEVSVLLERGQIRMLSGDAAGAFADFTSILARSPAKEIAAPALAGRGWVRHDYGDLDGALWDFNAAVESDPGFADALFGRGTVALDQQRYSAAIADLTLAIAQRPSAVEFYLNRGNAEHDAGDLETAMRDYDTILKLQPGYADAYINRGAVSLDEEKYENVIADCDEAERLGSASVAPLHACRALAKFRLGYFAPARADLEVALAAEKKPGELFLIRGIMREATDDIAGALGDYDLAIKSGDDSALQAKVHRETAAARLNHRPVAAEAAFDVRPGDATWPAAIARFLQGKIATADLAAIIERSPADLRKYRRCDLHYFSAALALGRGESAVARAELEECIATRAVSAYSHDLARAQLGLLMPRSSAKQLKP